MDPERVFIDVTKLWLSRGDYPGIRVDPKYSDNVLIRAKRRLEGGRRGQGHVYGKAEVDVIRCGQPQEWQSPGARR